MAESGPTRSSWSRSDCSLHSATQKLRRLSKTMRRSGSAMNSMARSHSAALLHGSTCNVRPGSAHLATVCIAPPLSFVGPKPTTLTACVRQAGMLSVEVCGQRNPAHRARKGECQSLCGSMARPPFRSPGTPHGVPPQPIAENYTCPMTSGLSLLCNSRKEFAVLPSRDGAFQDLRRDHRARQRCASTGAGSAASRKRIRARLRNSRPNGCNQAPDPDGRCAPYDDAA